MIEYMHSRLRKIMHRLIGTPTVHHEVADAFTRILLELRGRGEELFHLVGWEGPGRKQGEKARREFSVVLMIPDQAGASRHRVLAEVMVHCGDNYKCRGMVENVAVRYAEDWYDWTIAKDLVYYRDKDAPEPRRIRLDEEGTQNGLESLKMIWREVSKVTGHAGLRGRLDFAQRLNRTVERIEGDGETLTAVEVEKWYRNSDGRGGDQSKALAVVRIALFAQAACRCDDGDGKARCKANIHNDAAADNLRPAVVVIDLSDIDAGQYKVKHIGVIYEGEWPITHHYRKSNPAPDMKGLENLVRGLEEDSPLGGMEEEDE